MENYYDEEKLDLKQFLFFVLKKWRMILVSLIAGLLLGSSISLYKMQSSTPQSVLNRLNKLNGGEINKYNVQLYSDYKKLYNATLKYENDSALMKLDANNVYTGNLVYSISANSKDIDKIGASLSGILEINNNLDVIAENTVYSAEELRELVNISFSTSNNDNILMTSDNQTGLLKIKVYGADRDSVEGIVEKLEKLANSTLKTIHSDFFGESIIKVQDSVVFGTDLDLLETQAKETTAKQTILTALMAVQAKLNEDERMYYGYYYNYDEYFAGAGSHFSLKWPVIICAVSGIAACAFYLLVYVFDNRFKNEDEYRDRCGLKLLSTLNLNKKEYSGIDKIINGFEKIVFNDEEYLKSVLKSLDDKKVLLCTDNSKLKELVGNINKKVKCFGTLDVDNNAIDELNGCDGVILSSEIGETEYKLIEREIEIAKRNNKEVLGIISIR